MSSYRHRFLRLEPDEAEPSVYWGQTSTGVRAPEILAGATTIMSRTRHIARDDISVLRVRYAGWSARRNSNGTEVVGSGGGTFTVTSSIESAAGVILGRNRWSSVDSVVFNTGDDSPESDDTILSSTILDGTTYFCRQFIVAPEGNALVAEAGTSAIGNFPAVGALDTANGEGFRFGSVLDQTGTGGALTGGTNSTVMRYGPMAIISPTVRPTVAIFGDSIKHGVCDSYVGDTEGMRGLEGRAIGKHFGVGNFAQSGASATQNLNNISRRGVYLAYYSHAYNGHGRNDLSQLLNANSAITAVNAFTDHLKTFNSSLQIVGCTCTPTATSTDDWMTVSNQTPNSNFLALIPIYNPLVRDGALTGTVGYVDMGDATMNSRDTSKWRTAPGEDTVFYACGDTTHPTNNMSRLVRSEGWIPASLFTR